MTETTVQRPVADEVPTPIELSESLEQENVRLRRQLADLNASMDQLVDEQLADWVTLHESDLQIHARLDAEHVLNTVLDWAMLVTSAIAGALYLVADPLPHVQQDRTLRAVAQQGYWPEMDLDQPLQWPVGQDILARALETGQVVQQVHVCDEITDPSLRGTDRSHLAIPIRDAHQSAIGVIALESAFAGGFTAAQVDLAARLADQAALAIQNALRFQEIDQRLASLRAVHQSSLRLASCLDSSELPQAIVRYARKCLKADRAALYQYDDAAGSWVCVAASRPGGDHPTIADSSDLAIVQAAAADNTAHFAHDTAGTSTAALPLPTENLLVSTVPTNLEILGILLLSFKSNSSLFPIDPEPLYLYANQAAVALQNARRVDRLERAIHHQQEHANYTTNQSRAPMTAVKGYTRLMLQQIGGDLTGQQREFLQTILKNASQLEILLDKQPDPVPA